MPRSASNVCASYHLCASAKKGSKTAKGRIEVRKRLINADLSILRLNVQAISRSPLGDARSVGVSPKLPILLNLSRPYRPSLGELHGRKRERKRERERERGRGKGRGGNSARNSESPQSNALAIIQFQLLSPSFPNSLSRARALSRASLRLPFNDN